MAFEEAKDWGWQKVHDPTILPDVLRLIVVPGIQTGQ
jgi:hypothetical protein